MAERDSVTDPDLHSAPHPPREGNGVRIMLDVDFAPDEVTMDSIIDAREIPLGADALPLVELMEDVEDRNRRRAEKKKARQQQPDSRTIDRPTNLVENSQSQRGRGAQ